MIKMIKRLWKGYTGEKQTMQANNELKEIFPDMIVFGNVMLPLRKVSPNGEVTLDTFQIDSMMISPESGIMYVTETKRYSGEITGVWDEKNWTVSYGPEKHTMYNPVFQNEAHVVKLINFFRQQLGVTMSKDNFEAIVHMIIPYSSFKVNVPKNYYTEEQYKKYFPERDPRNICIGDPQQTDPSLSYKQRVQFLETKALVDIANGVRGKPDIKRLVQLIDENNMTKGLSLESIKNHLQHVKNVKAKAEKAKIQRENKPKP